MKSLPLKATFIFLWLSVPTIALADQSTGYSGRHMMWDGGWHGMFFGPLMMIIFLAIAVAVVVLIIRWLGGWEHGSSSSAKSSDNPLDILKKRFAHGEIDKDEYEERRRVLEG
ncbi:MAG: SHOCT domain-containing protein [Rhodospirillaceae bacterium]|jgi:putative membrane protein